MDRNDFTKASCFTEKSSDFSQPTHFTKTGDSSQSFAFCMSTAFHGKEPQ